MWKLFLLAGTGGFLGSSLRFLVNTLFLKVWHTSFPIATFTVNSLGCLIFGIITGLLMKYGVVSPKLNALLIVGFCGGFTTFSTFSAEGFNLFRADEMITALFYIGGSIIVGLIAVAIGLLIAR